MSVYVLTSDGHVCALSLFMASQALTLKTMLDDLGEVTTPDAPAPLCTVTKAQLDVLVAWAALHEHDPEPALADGLPAVAPLTQDEWILFRSLTGLHMYGVLQAADFLDIRAAAAAAAAALARRMAGRDALGICNVMGRATLPSAEAYKTAIRCNPQLRDGADVLPEVAEYIAQVDAEAQA